MNIKSLLNIGLNLIYQMKNILPLLLIMPNLLFGQIKSSTKSKVVTPNKNTTKPATLQQNSRFATTKGTSNQLSGNQFEHDASGNITKDLTQGITSIIYDTYLKKPKEYNFVDGRKLNIYYDGSGRKLKSVLTKNNILIVEYDYVGNLTFIKKQGDTESKLMQIDLPEADGRAIPDATDPSKFTYEFDIKDHTGSPRVTFKANSNNQLEVVRSQDYDPFGVVLEGINIQTPSDTLNRKYFFNGKEYMITVGLKMYDYGARQYNPRLGRFYQVDPKADLMPSWSPYVFSFNNPLRYIDYDGQIPYPITVRSFAPFNTFGFGFHGDGANRGFTTATATARVHQNIYYDSDKSTISSMAWSDKSYHPVLGVDRAIPTLKFGSYSNTEITNGVTRSDFSTSLAAANPLTPEGTPNINVESLFSVTSNKNKNTLSIMGMLSGDNFPSTEAFIKDPKGQSVFLGVGFYEGDPYRSLAGEDNKRLISDFNISIKLDSKGNFSSIMYNDKTYSISDWNKRFQNANPHDKESMK